MTNTTLNLAAIQLRDPFLLAVAEEGAYYLFGSTDADIWHAPATGFDCYRSTDLETWEGPIEAFRPPLGFWSDRNFWAPEVHAHAGRYFMFATFTAEGERRGTQVLASDAPQGPYAPWSDGPVTPRDWECLDGTLHVDAAGDPWIVFCHEWVQVVDGEVVAQRLSDDLSRAIGDPILLFHGSDAPWARPVAQRRFAVDVQAYVTDGPFLHRLASGELLMLWSGFGDSGYAMGIARSESGTVRGPWTQEERPIWSRDGGHGMIARTLDGGLLLTLHQPNDTPNERAAFFPLVEEERTVVRRT